MGKHIKVTLTNRAFYNAIGAVSPFVVWRDADGLHSHTAKASVNLFYNGSLAGVNPTEILAIGAGVTSVSSFAREKASLVAMRGTGWDVSGITTMSFMCQDCTSLREVDCKGWNLSACTQVVNVFRNCTSLKAIDVSDWKTSAITTAQGAFSLCTALLGVDMSRWDTSSLGSIQSLFNACRNLKSLGLPALKSGCVTTYALDGCTSLKDVRCGGLIYPSVSFIQSPLTAESVIDILDHLADTPDSGATITFKSGLYAGFTAEQKEVIDAKRSAAVAHGWTIVNMS